MHEKIEKNLFMYEVMRSRLQIKNFFLQTAVREIYENIGQVLSLVRVQLADLENKYEADKTVYSCGELLGQTIRDLRTMSKSFFPDDCITEEDGFVKVFKSLISHLFSNNSATVAVTGVRNEIGEEMQLMIFKMLMDLLVDVKEMRGNFIGLNIAYTKAEVTFLINYRGEAIELNKENAGEDFESMLTLQERVNLIRGKIELSIIDQGTTQVKLISPLNTLFYV